VTVNPLTNRILARRVKGEKTTRDGIALPDTARERPESDRKIESEGNIRETNHDLDTRAAEGAYR
jgi:co-chaperonin GroES (HSP10)